MMAGWTAGHETSSLLKAGYGELQQEIELDHFEGEAARVMHHRAVFCLAHATVAAMATPT